MRSPDSARRDDAGAVPAAASHPANDINPRTQVAGRYTLGVLLGRGGMGSVYRVTDAVSGSELALKQLRVRPGAHKAVVAALFEQEFRTLAQLDHPCVIRVYDYGLDPDGPYYTMELLEGVSVASRAPLPWREASALAHDVCSSLALLHSRRWLHRDVSPMNVRCTADGRAKLIDFGAMTVMGPSNEAVGTPGFAAPETAYRLTLDARTDLYSLGATLYFALTGQAPYERRGSLDLGDAWRTAPAPPSAFASDIPPRLDALVLALVSAEPALRPKSASEVMQQLVAIAGLERQERLDAARAYLATPALIGGDSLLAQIREHSARTLRRRGATILIEGRPGSGRSRNLDAAALEAQTQGLTIFRANGRDAGSAPFALADVIDRMLETLPDACADAARDPQIRQLLCEPGEALHWRSLETLATEPRASVHEALARLWLAVADRRSIALAIDDVDQIDRAGGAWIATVADRARRHRLLLLCTAEAARADRDPLLRALRERAIIHPLSPLGRAEVERLLGSVFGDVPHVGILADRVFRVAHGNPRACMDLAQHLSDRGLIHYEAGSWVLPADLDAHELPQTMDQAWLERAATWSVAARRLAEYHALCRYQHLSLDDCLQLFEGDGLDYARLVEAQTELFSQGVLGVDASTFRLTSEAWVQAVAKTLISEELRARHRALGELGLARGKPQLQAARHLFDAGLDARALDVISGALTAELASQDTLTNNPELDHSAIGKLFNRALEASKSLGRRPLELAELRRGLCALSAVCDDVTFAEVGPAWLDVLRRDSGLLDWQELASVEDPAARLTQALQRAAQRYTDTAEAERTYRRANCTSCDRTGSSNGLLRTGPTRVERSSTVRHARVSSERSMRARWRPRSSPGRVRMERRTPGCGPARTASCIKHSR